MNTETEIDRMKRIPIEDFLARLGHHPVQRRANAVWYRSPYREEKTPSFKVNPEKNLWYDFGEGKGGNIFALAGEFIRSDDFLTRRCRVCRFRNMSRVRIPECDKLAGRALRMWRYFPCRTGLCSIICKSVAYRPPSP